MPRTRTIAGLAAALALGLTGCGTANTDSASAAKTTAAAPVVKSGDTIKASELSSKVLAAMSKAGSGRMTTDAGGEEAVVEFCVGPDGKANFSAESKIEGEAFQLLVVDGVGYMKAASLSKEAGKPYVKVAAGGKDIMSQLMGPLIAEMDDAFNANSMGDIAKDDSATVTSVSGDQTTYHMDVDPAKFISQMKTKLEKFDLAGAMPKFDVAKMPPMFFDLTVDKDTLPSKVVASITSDGTSAEKETITYSDWGAPITIAAPPADQVGTLDMPSPGAS